MITLRPYQREAIDSVFAYWRRGGTHPVVEVPTGGGKSAILGQLAREVVEMGSQVLIATHRRELIEQDAAACRSVWPDAPIGIYSAGLGSRRVNAITVAGIQSIRKRAQQMGNVGVMVIDEAHLVSTTAQTSYRMLVDGLMDINPELRIVGLTATPYRLGQGYLTQGKDALFKSIVYRVPMRDLVRDGYLSPLVSAHANAAINLGDVRTQAGEYVMADLELAADVDAINETVAKDVHEQLTTSGRTSALLFGVSVAHATRMAVALRWLGVSCEVVTGETAPPERKRILAAFKARQIQAIASCDVLTTGFDAPCVDVIALVRPTQSTSLYVQMLGRGSRRCDGKKDCAVLDYGANVARHGPVDDVRPPKPKGDGDGKAPFKYCEACSAENPASARTCIECDAPFPEQVRKASEKASKLPVMSTQEKKDLRQRHVVGDVTWAKHTKRDNPDATPTLRLDYYGDGIGKKIASEWVCFEHAWGSFAWRNATMWWVRNAQGPAPETIDDAVAKLDAGLMKPIRAIVTEPDGKFTRVVGHEHAPIREPGADDDAEPVPTAATEALSSDEIEDIVDSVWG